MNESLAAAIQEHGFAISARVLADMYRDPFWLERFGARGQKHAEEDSRYHVSYLVQALVAGDPEVLGAYARWLRTLLVSRGMCTRHLDENLERLGRALEAAIEGASLAAEYLNQARASLSYPGGAARELEAAAPRLADEAVDDLPEPERCGPSAWGEAGRAARREHLAHYFSYLTDAAACNEPGLFGEYVGFLLDAAARAGRSPDPVYADLAVLAVVVARAPELGPETRIRVSELFAAAHAAIQSRAPLPSAAGGAP